MNWARRDIISRLDSKLNQMIDKYQYNIYRYTNNLDYDIRNPDGNNYGYLYNTFSNYEDGETDPASINVIKSVVDSIVSKLSNNKTRPFFNAVNGDYNTECVINQAQIYFDQVFDDLGLHDIIADAFKDACIFGIGYVFLDPFTFEVENLPSFQIATLDSEGLRPTKMLIEKKQIPSFTLKKYKLGDDLPQYVDLAIYVDVQEQEAVLFINNQLVKEIKYVIDQLPIVMIYYNKPIAGSTTSSLVDDLDSIQDKIDLIEAKKARALRTTPATTTFLYSSNSNIKTADIQNAREGSIYEVDLDPGMTQLPIQVVTQPPYDSALDQAKNDYIQQAYDMAGISQLSAQSKKPSGLNSGVSLQTMEDIESDRFERQVTHYTNAYVDLAKLMIRMIPDDLPILPESNYNSSYSWKELKEQSNLYKIQYSAASALSKDPAERAKQIIEWEQVGLVNPEEVAQYSNTPDFAKAYQNASALSRAMDAVINNAIEKHVYYVPDFVNYDQLSSRIARTQCKLYASLTGNADEKVLTSLADVNALEEVLNQKMIKEGFIKVDQPTETTTAESGMSVGGMAAGTQAISAADAMQDSDSQGGGTLNSVDQMSENQAAEGLM